MRRRVRWSHCCLEPSICQQIHADSGAIAARQGFGELAPHDLSVAVVELERMLSYQTIAQTHVYNARAYPY